MSNPDENYKEDRYLPYHRCTEEDYAQFYPVSADSQALFADIRADEKRGFYCIDAWEEEDLELGLTQYNHASLIDIIVAPCNLIEPTEQSFKNDIVTDECNAD